MDGIFTRPVVFFAPRADGSLQHVELASVEQGFRALNRGLEGFCLDAPEWHLAFHQLSRAMLDRSADRVEAARAALDLLAGLTRERAVARRRSLH